MRHKRLIQQIEQDITSLIKFKDEGWTEKVQQLERQIMRLEEEAELETACPECSAVGQHYRICSQFEE